MVLLISGIVFSTFIFTPDCKKPTTASMLATLAHEKAKITSINFETNEYTFVNEKGNFIAKNNIGCFIKK
jgi:hypothetical protein